MQATKTRQYKNCIFTQITRSSAVAGMADRTACISTIGKNSILRDFCFQRYSLWSHRLD